jgi:hypothetical protein
LIALIVSVIALLGGLIPLIVRVIALPGGLVALVVSVVALLGEPVAPILSVVALLRDLVAIRAGLGALLRSFRPARPSVGRSVPIAQTTAPGMRGAIGEAACRRRIVDRYYPLESPATPTRCTGGGLPAVPHGLSLPLPVPNQTYGRQIQWCGSEPLDTTEHPVPAYLVRGSHGQRLVSDGILFFRKPRDSSLIVFGTLEGCSTMKASEPSGLLGDRPAAGACADVLARWDLGSVCARPLWTGIYGGDRPLIGR